MKNLKAIIMIILFLAAPSVFAQYSGGSGSPDDPWQISCPNDLLYLAGHPEHYNSHFILTSDINLADYTFSTAVIAPDTNSVLYYCQGPLFNGTFDGNGFVIENLTIDSNGVGNDCLGLFGKIGTNCIITNLGIEDFNIIDGDFIWYIGGLVGNNYRGSINNCYTKGSITTGEYSEYVGGLAGSSFLGTISNSYSMSDMRSGYRTSILGGLVGRDDGSIIYESYWNGSITCGNDSWIIGGLIGDHYGNKLYGSLKNSYANGTVIVGNNSHYIGGLSGGSYAKILNCYSECLVIAGDSSESLAGLVGASYGPVSECFSGSMVLSGSKSYYVGGLMGSNFDVISNCYSTSDVTAGNNSKYISGLVGFNFSLIISPPAAGGNTQLVDQPPRYGHFGEISNSYSSGLVNVGFNSQYLGGLLGGNDRYGTVSNCFWDEQTTGMQNGYGENIGTISNLIGKTTEEMQIQSTFTDYGWDFAGEVNNGTEDIWFVREGREYPKLSWQNNKPVANAGTDQKVYAWIDGFVRVGLDGSASFDEDGDDLTYQWTWTINGNNFDANGVNPTIELPVGEHKISLVVSDFLDESESDDVNVAVVAPIQGQLRIQPRAINLQGQASKIMATLVLPQGITPEDIDPNFKLRLYANSLEYDDCLEAINQRIYRRNINGAVQTVIHALFERSDLSAFISSRGTLNLIAAGQLKTGQYFFGSDTVMVLKSSKQKF